MNKFVICDDGTYYLLEITNYNTGIVIWTNDKSSNKSSIGNVFVVDIIASGKPKFVDNEKEISDLIEKYPELFEVML